VSVVSAARRTRAAAPHRAGRRGRVRVVDLLRFVLPALALMLTGLVVFWPQIMGGYGGLIVPMMTSGQIGDADVMRMHNPRYVGRTSADEPYAVTAASAQVDPTRPNFIQLDQMAADLVTADRRDIRVTALSGTYDRAGEQLDLDGGVELITSDGYRFVSESAELLLRLGRVVGRQPIAGQGPLGSLDAQRFEILDGGEILRFEGRVKVIVEPGVHGSAGS
jgi:lipopolysaccharide export system protein LptC